MVKRVGDTCTARDQYYAQQAGMTAGIVLAVLIPLVIVFVCFVCHYRRSHFGPGDRVDSGKRDGLLITSNNGVRNKEERSGTGHSWSTTGSSWSQQDKGSRKRSKLREEAGLGEPREPGLVREVHVSRPAPLAASNGKPGGSANGSSSASTKSSPIGGVPRGGPQGSSLKGVKLMDGVYYTGEPLGHNKNSDFADYDNQSETI
jgi:hypothetical protein